jgi:SAM-dependent methyltransferase
VHSRRLRQLQEDWDYLSETDPLWAILSDPRQRNGQWNLDVFLATGRREIDDLMKRAIALGRPLHRGAALDFGCGVGRLTRAMASYFNQCVGLDISEGMLSRATAINADVANLSFVHNPSPDLSLFKDGSFDLVYSNIVLQHLPDRETASRYIQEFVRVLAPGGLLIFQLPGRIPLRHRLQMRRRLYALVRRAGVQSDRLVRALGLHPIRMIGIPEGTVVALVEGCGGSILEVVAEPIGSTTMMNRTYYVTRSAQRSDTMSPARSP